MQDDIKTNLGCIPSPWDQRNLKYIVRAPLYEEIQQIPEEYDGLAKYCFCTGTQGGVGSCCGWAGKHLLYSLILLNDRLDVEPSAGSIFSHSHEYCVPPMAWDANGSQLIGALKFIQKVGSPTEKCSPTDISLPFSLNECDTWQDTAKNYRISSYHSVPTDESSMKAAIYGITYTQPFKMEDGSPGKSPLLVAIPAFDCFYNNTNGVVKTPVPGEKMWGYHAVVIRGWKKINDKLYWIIVNSWGKDDGDNGIWYIPNDYPIAEAWLATDDSKINPFYPPDTNNGLIAVIRSIISMIKIFFKFK